ncbi:UDP-N-acetylmuramate--L-alanine ligase [Cryomorpha ignava]|uniref:UDP-N-acetylmuramate--L-alanine ligase n=1 Tax=Cryomorpha ignava TaxID=101383 RepID=A0A7K3WMV2_9FLAO|nr:UDP-N-acetylmuramate--L-alanine ligase [Cryomorpha ignava]NEN22980.1 UDP-N-acetylmuramate--L-alanine ligase [Cryomorpha ignava]
MNLEKIHSVYFVGIGGIGMSAIARYFKAMGKNVFGYDRVHTALTANLESEGMQIVYTDNPEELAPDFLNQPIDNTLVVYTPAIPVTHAGLGYLRQHGYRVVKRSEVLSEIIEKQKTIAIAGTHGKTTTSAMVAHILNHSGIKCNAFLGGIALNFNSNVILNPDAEYAVVEADEYDRSFLKLNPFLAIITSVDADHLDIYDNADAMHNAFQEFANKVSDQGAVFIHSGISLSAKAKKITYSLDDKKADLYASSLHIENGTYVFDVIFQSKNLGTVRSTYPGHHNIENAITAIGIALELGIEWGKIVDSIATFAGVKRRFEYHIKRNDRVFIDDYAHHPTEISACVGSVKELYPDSRITGVFQPHLYSRTRDFGDGFARSLEALNEVVLMEIYPAREEPIPGIDSEWLLNKVRTVNKKLVQRENLVDEILRLDPEVLLTMGAGDIDKMIEPLKSALNEKDE